MNGIEMGETCAVVAQVIDERKRQHGKWGEQNHDPAFWLSILGEEFGEVCKAVCEGKIDEYMTELIQVAAVAVQMVECERRRRDGIKTD